MGGAGRQAAGFDASTAGGNPAAMTRLDRSQMEGGIISLYVNSQFNVKNASNGYNGSGNAGGFSPVPTLYYVYSLNPDLKLGLGVGSYFGGGSSYSHEWTGKYYEQSLSLPAVVFNPSIGYKIADWLSIGTGVSIIEAKLSTRTAVKRSCSPGTDASSTMRPILPTGTISACCSG